MNTKPYIIVQNKPYHATLVFSAKIALWATVKVTPDDNKIIVFKKGMPHGLIIKIPLGGQIQNKKTEGDKLKWKKAQKKETKNITSETINKNIPKRKAFWTNFVCCPSYEASKITSENQEYIEITNKNNPIKIL